jgi:hypothetical protein
VSPRKKSLGRASYNFPSHENSEYLSGKSRRGPAFSSPGQGRGKGGPSGRVGVGGRYHHGAPRMLVFHTTDGATAKGRGCVGKPDPAAAPVRCPECLAWVWIMFVTSKNRGKHLRKRNGQFSRLPERPMFVEKMTRAIDSEKLAGEDYDQLEKDWNDKEKWPEDMDFGGRQPLMPRGNFIYAWEVAATAWGAIAMHAIVDHIPFEFSKREFDPESESRFTEGAEASEWWPSGSPIHPWSEIGMVARREFATAVVDFYGTGEFPIPDFVTCPRERDIVFAVASSLAPRGSIPVLVRRTVRGLVRRTVRDALGGKPSAAQPTGPVS